MAFFLTSYPICGWVSAADTLSHPFHILSRSGAGEPHFLTGTLLHQEVPGKEPLHASIPAIMGKAGPKRPAPFFIFLKNGYI
jgi:hypothetical protein